MIGRWRPTQLPPQTNPDGDVEAQQRGHPHCAAWVRLDDPATTQLLQERGHRLNPSCWRLPCDQAHSSSWHQEHNVGKQHTLKSPLSMLKRASLRPNGSCTCDSATTAYAHAYHAKQLGGKTRPAPGAVTVNGAQPHAPPPPLAQLLLPGATRRPDCTRAAECTPAWGTTGHLGDGAHASAAALGVGQHGSRGRTHRAVAR